MPVCPELTRQLESADVELLREGAWKAGEDGCEDAVPLLVRLLGSKNIGVQEAAEQALRRIGGEATVRNIAPFLRSEEAPLRNMAMDILREVGNQDFKTLVDILHDQDPDIRIFAADILGSTANVLAVTPLCDSLLKDPEVNVRYQAAVSLGNLAFKEAARCLGKALDDDEWVQFAVIEALSKIRDDSGVDALVKTLGKSSDLVASMIVEALGEMGNIKAASLLLKRLDEANTALRNKMVKSIVRILGGKSLKLLSPVELGKFRDYLLVAMDDEEKDIQDAAILGSGYVGDDAAADKVLELAGNMEPDLEHDRLEVAITALANMGSLDALGRALLQKGHPQRAQVAVEALSRIQGAAVGALLMRAFPEADRDLQREIARALQNVAGAEAAPFFLDLLRGHDDGTVLKGALAFVGSRLRLEEAADAVVALLDHPYNDVKEAALEAAIAIGGPSMARHFEDLFASDDPLHRLMAVYAMGKLGNSGHAARLTEALSDPIPDIRKVALESLAELSGYGPECAPYVQEKLSDGSRDVRMVAVEVSGKLPPETAVPNLLNALGDEDDWVRIRSMDALAAMREHSAVPALVGLVESPNKLLAIKAIECLGAIGGQAAFRALLEISGGEDPELMAAAEEAVGRLHSGEEGA